MGYVNIDAIFIGISLLLLLALVFYTVRSARAFLKGRWEERQTLGGYIQRISSSLTPGNLAKLVAKYAPTPANIIKLSNYRVWTFGAQYRMFGFFALTFYIVTHAFWGEPISERGFVGNIEIALQLLGCLLAAGLIVVDIWPEEKKSYLPLYWHLSLMYCLTFMPTFLYLCHYGSMPWLVNLSVSLFLLATVVEWTTFLLLSGIGTSLAYGLYSLLFGAGAVRKLFFADHKNLMLYVYMLVFSSIVGMLFSRNREYIQVVVRNRRLNMVNQDLTRALALKEEVLNNISHEVRTPVQAVTGMSRGLVDAWDMLSNDQRFGYARRVAQASQRMVSLMNNLLDMSKINAGKMVLRLKYDNLKQVISEMIDECNLLYTNDKPISLEFSVKGEIPYTMLDKDRLSQVLRNLLANAIKFTDQGVIKIELSCLSGDSLVVSIEDQGVGVPEDELEDIFLPFVQSTTTKDGSGGTGLGLAICQGIITEHSGRIWAERGESGGAKFVFVIPVRQE